jgi:LPXTG-site transpeptidase (sortase) family protein
MGEVNYFSSKVAMERNIEAPTIVIPSIGVFEKINEESLSLGVMHGQDSYDPTDGDVVLFGHRTLQGSPFLRLNELSAGDKLILEWPDEGEFNYNVVDSTIVPATYQLDSEAGGNLLYLVTCDPIGSTENRLIIKGELESTEPLNTTIIQNNPQESNALIITAVFLIVGLILTLLYPKDQRIYILAVILTISFILFYCCFNPIPSEIIYDKINFFSGGM